MPLQENDILMTWKETAEYLGRSITTIKRWLGWLREEDGRKKYVIEDFPSPLAIGGRWLFSRNAIDDWLHNNLRSKMEKNRDRKANITRKEFVKQVMLKEYQEKYERDVSSKKEKSPGMKNQTKRPINIQEFRKLRMERNSKGKKDVGED